LSAYWLAFWGDVESFRAVGVGFWKKRGFFGVAETAVEALNGLCGA